MSAKGIGGPVVALTGTPGTGKTSVARRLQAAGVPVLDLKRYVGDPRFDLGADPERPGTTIIDVDILSDHLRDHLVGDLGLEAGHQGAVVIESHFAHDLDVVDRILVLRCRPSVLRERLAPRGWTEAKLHENLEAEGLDLILQEAVAVREAAASSGEEVAVGEIDATDRPLDGVVAAVRRLLDAPASDLQVGLVDWSDELIGGF